MEDGRLDPAEVTALYAEHSEQLRNFLRGVLKDANLVQDVLQATFVKLLEQGGATQEQSRKAWLFKVAYNQAREFRRREATGDRILREKVGPAHPHAELADALEHSLRFETVELVKQAMTMLSSKQLEVVRLRVYEEKKFAEIAEDLQVPLGTVLSRMRTAVEKMRAWMDSHQSHE